MAYPINPGLSPQSVNTPEIGWVACGPRVVPHPPARPKPIPNVWPRLLRRGEGPQPLRWVENALDLHTVWLRPAAAGPEAPRSARARRMLKRSPYMGGTAVLPATDAQRSTLNTQRRARFAE